MKKLVVLALTLTAFPLHAQSIWGAFNDYQNTLSGSASNGGTSSVPEVKPDNTGGSTSSTKQCTSNDQTSLPLSVITSLIMEKDGKLDIIHDASTGEMTIQVPRMVGNCSNMIEWKVKKPTIKGKLAYAIEATIKQGESCNNTLCNYKYAKVENGDFKGWETKPFAPTLKGFEECLKQSGVVKMVTENGKQVPKPDPQAIYPVQVKEKRTGLNESGNLFFLSSGPSSITTGPKYTKAFDYIDGCDHYEQAHPEIKELLTVADEEKRRLDAEAARLRECKVDEYGKLAEFIEKYEGYAQELGTVRDRLILEAAQKAAKNISEGKYTDEDLKVLADFEKYVVQPKVELAVKLYEESLDAEGDERKLKQQQFQAVIAELAALNKKPYFEQAHLTKLMNDGKFEDAEKLNGIQLTLNNYTKLGQQIQNVKYTPSVAASNVASGRATFAANLETEKEKYMYRTGQSTGKAEYYTLLAKRMNDDIQTRTANFNAEIQLEAQRIQQPNGYCYKYWRNTQRCIQDSLARIQELQAILQHYNKVDQERAAEYTKAAQEWGALEDQGRRYLAGDTSAPASNTPVTNPSTAPTTSAPTAPTPRADNGVYSFDFNQPQGPQQPQFTPQQYQYPMQPGYGNNMFQQQQNPYGYYQQGFMGQSGFGGYQPQQYGYQPSGVYNFGWGGGMPQQPYGGYGGYGNGYGGYSGGYGQFGGGYGGQQGGYWNAPYQAYNAGYNMYGYGGW